MARKPDLDALVIPKADEPPSPGESRLSAEPAPPPPLPTPAEVSAAQRYSHTLSLRLTTDQYRRLRRFAVAEEERSGQRVTHQAVIERALAEYLSSKGA
jgi:hypothetical protein